MFNIFEAGLKYIGAKPAQQQLTKKQTERRNKAQLFINDYNAIRAKHGMSLEPFLQVTKTGVKPVQEIADYEVPETPVAGKPWHEALRENLSTRINYKHKLNEEEIACQKCALPTTAWGEGDEGVTDQYNQTMKAKIKQAEQEHEKKNQEADTNQQG